ncbi:hypothetical protein BD410DRAFT_797094 [Rickenella mellea]|uniref:Uncharacterized protein n=1 Tax=Rickenella mellea TaxID=50990 RepID=A0A4Y7PGH9_9AGAM|nr:hypothetical protein BD410DRAFT_797094 [Rickenella mellea]
MSKFNERHTSFSWDARPLRQSTSIRIGTLYIAIALSVVLMALPVSATNCSNDVQTSWFNWFGITPSENLTWSNCYDTFQCARLSVPLDYSQPNGEKAAIAMLKLSAKVAPGNSTYRGPILINPGGPGGSGVSTVLSTGVQLQTILGDEFDILGFDPRGVNFTTPSLNIFQTKSEQAAWNTDHVVVLNATVDALGYQYARSQIIGQFADNRTRHSAEHIGTPTVARDMLSIVKAHGMDKLQYWGFSYGSVLGATFAAMFPENVGRLAIDGVADSDAYYAAQYAGDIAMADDALLNLYDACVAAGPTACPLHDTSSALIKKRVDQLLESLKTTPIPYYNPATNEYAVIDFSFTKTFMRLALYQLHSDGSALVAALAELEKGNPEPIFLFGGGVDQKDQLACDCSSTSPFLPSTAGLEVTAASGCGDATVVNATVSDLKAELQAESNISSFEDVWDALRVFCAGWKVQSTDKFTGNFSVAGAYNTSFPLLVIGNTIDPATPLTSAQKMSRAFKGSVLLTQNSAGHTSLSATSLCTATNVRNYFRNGTLPANGTVCQTESSIFGGATSASRRAVNPEDSEILHAVQGLQEKYFIHTGF